MEIATAYSANSEPIYLAGKKVPWGEFPGSPEVKPAPSIAEGPGSTPGQGTKIPQASWCSQKKKCDGAGWAEARAAETQLRRPACPTLPKRGLGTTPAPPQHLGSDLMVTPAF